MNPAEWETEQQRLAQLVVVPEESCLPLASGCVLLALDVQYQGNTGQVAAAIRTWGRDEYQLFGLQQVVDTPYVSGYFAFREGPLLLGILERLANQLDLTQAIVLIDGHGIAHPRRLGLASWVGVRSTLQTIGIAKDTLLRYEGELGASAGSNLPIFRETEEVGRVLRTQDGIKPVFVSPGHRISLADAQQVVWEMRSPYRIIEPIRQADQLARAMAKGEAPASMALL